MSLLYTRSYQLIGFLSIQYIFKHTVHKYWKKSDLESNIIVSYSSFLYY